MQVTLKKISQSFDIEKSQFDHFLVLGLSNGDEVVVDINEDDYAKVVESMAEAMKVEEPEEVQSSIDLGESLALHEQPDDEPEEPEPPNKDDLVTWRELPPTVLSSTMKKILEDIELPEIVQFETLEAIINAVVESQSPENKPSEQSIEISDSVVIRKRVPRRSVQKDDMGYPIVQQRPPVPRARAIEDTDEDGIAQL